MKKRILSLLLALCLLVGLLPTAVFAAEPEEALYAQMLELGLVDADGALIEDNTFTVEDGTRLLSLDELIEWLNQCEESDLDKIITVDSTGKSATVEQIMYALIIEYQIADVAGQLNTLASGTYAAAASSAAGAIDATVHNLKVGMVMSYGSSSVYSLRVNLYDKNTNNIVTAPHDVTVEVGLFADFLNVGAENYAANGSNVPGTNYFKEFTILKGTSSISFQLDLQKLRENYLSKNNGLWDGNAYMLIQARTVSKDSRMPDSSDTIYMKIAPDSNADPVVNAITGGTVIGKNDDANQTVVPYRLSWTGNGTTTTVDNRECFAFTVDIPAAKDSYNNSTFGWKNYFGRALEAGVGDAKPEIKLENVTIWTQKSNKTNFPRLYAEILDSEDPNKNEYVLIGWSPLTYTYEFDDNSTAADYVAQMTRVHLGRWDDSSTGVSDVSNDTLYKKIKNHDWRIAHFPDVEVPLTYWNKYGVGFPSNWYLTADWLEDNDGTGPDEILMHGAMTIVDNVNPTVKSIDVPAYEDKTGKANADFYPGNVIPIVVTFTEPVYGDYELVYLDGTDTKTLSSQISGKVVAGDVTRSSSNPILSNTRVFYYTVRSTDNTVPTEINPDVYFKVMGVKPVGDNCKDVYGNEFNTNAGSGTDAYWEFPKELLTGCIKGGDLKYGLKSMTVTPDPQDPRTFTFTVDVDTTEAFQNECLNWNHTATVYVYKNGVYTEDAPSITLLPTVADDGTSNQRYVLTGKITFEDDVSEDTPYVAELVFDTYYFYGIYATFTQKPITYAGPDAYTINVDSGWPSGIDNTIFKQDEESVILSFTDNYKDYTYKYLGLNEVVWKVSNPAVIVVEPLNNGTDLTLTQASKVKITAKGVGTATIYLECRNNGITYTTASNTITVTVKDNGKPTLLFPKGADTIYAQVDTDQTVNFVSNLDQHAPADGEITARLYERAAVSPLTLCRSGQLHWSAAPPA